MNGEQALLAINKNIESLRNDVTHVMMEGCAKREGDLKQIEDVKSGLQTMQSDIRNIYRASLVTAVGIIAFLLKAFLPYFIP